MKSIGAAAVAAIVWLSVCAPASGQDRMIEPRRLLDQTEDRHLLARRNLERILREQPEFWLKLGAVARRLEIDPAWLLNVLACESLFVPGARNPLPGQTASGLLQIIESTAASLETTTAAIRRMTPVEQLPLIERYLTPFRGRLKSLADLYSAVFRGSIPDGDETTVILDSERVPRKYGLNRSLDLNRDGRITKGELNLTALSVGRFAFAPVPPIRPKETKSLYKTPASSEVSRRRFNNSRTRSIHILH
jgi:hypothetical protein